MDIDRVIENILYMPSRFKSLGNISMVTLLKESGYIEAHENISEHDIKGALIKHQECTKDWFISSEDNRRDRGWYVLQKDNGNYTVGYLFKGDLSVLLEYENAEDACAAYIKKEIEGLRNIACSSVSHILDIFVAAIIDWPDSVLNWEDLESAIKNFIHADPTEETIKMAIKKIDYTRNSWQAESLTQILKVFQFYKKGISLKEIIEDVKIKLEKEKD